MTSILTGRNIFKRAKEICGSKSGAILAVSYWSGGATKALQISRNAANVRVVLDVKHGGTSPDELKELMGLLGENVRVHPDIHSKIYASEDAALIGSANASQPGLHLKGCGHAEAAVFLSQHDAKDAMAIAQKMFKNGKPATYEDVEICYDRFFKTSLARAEAGYVEPMSLFKSLLEQPDIFRHMPFILTNEEVSQEQRDAAYRASIKHESQEEAVEFNAKYLDDFAWCLDKKYRSRNCIALHVRGARAWVGLVHPPAYQDEAWTFAQRLPWSEIDGLIYRGVGAREIPSREEGRENLVKAVNELASLEFVRGDIFIEKLKLLSSSL